ncbi:hypothetical protein [Tahibacter soli]|uniref:Uncharacterized protein n=1 Tax=Tahibacter soli TaxID=2983605 RepID=A0A9X3YNB3_9GAMM|nr:hypothetical protein [Tahibacter soli]MDC8013898.1 hypothetical protein [Tahibacter soli]
MQTSKKAVFVYALFTAVASPMALAQLNCGGPTLNTNQPPYSQLETVRNSFVTIEDEEAVRSGLITALVGAYRSIPGNGTFSLPPGSPVRVVYEDRSKECGIVISQTGSMSAVPVPGSRREAPGGGAGGGENTNMYIRQFQRNGVNGFYQVCYDYYSNGELTETQCSVQTW